MKIDAPQIYKEDTNFMGNFITEGPVNKYSKGMGHIDKWLINTQLWAIKWKHNSQWFIGE